MSNVDDPNARRAIVRVGVNHTSLKAKKDLGILMDAMSNAQASALPMLGLLNIYNNTTNNNYTITYTKDKEDPRMADYDFLPVIQEAGIFDDIVALDERDVYIFKPSTGLWSKASMNEAAEIIRSSTKLKLNDADTAYIKSFDGPVKILRSMMSKIKDVKFPRKLNLNPKHCVAFDNGMYDAATDVLRPFVRSDFVETTIGYPHCYESTSDAMDFIQDFYCKIFPVPEEREYFLRMIAKALFSGEQSKHFLILTDDRDGNNGKTTLMRAVEAVFGSLKAPTEREFLYESTMVNSNGAAANFLSYIGKRLAFFDEPPASSSQRLDGKKLKDLTSGDARIRGRNLHESEVIEAPFEALIVIACNENNFPNVDASDVAFINRMKALRLRSLFVPEEVLGEYSSQEHVYPMGQGEFKAAMAASVGAHVNLLAEAYRRFLQHGLVEPECVKSVVNGITFAADGRFQVIQDFVDKFMDFNPKRTPDKKGLQYYAYVPVKSVMAAFWTWFLSYENEELRQGFSKAELGAKEGWKKMTEVVMKRKGRPVVQIRTTVDGQRKMLKVFNNTVLKEPAMEIDRTCSMAEASFRDQVEKATGLKFPKARPTWLVNPKTGKKLELDMFNADHKIAIEYNGPQHYMFPNVYHKTPEEFQAQQERDAIKRDVCHRRGIVLLEVPCGPTREAEIEWVRSRMPEMFGGLDLGFTSSISRS
jgi:phage/plasmid-associated DNA primase